MIAIHREREPRHVCVLTAMLLGGYIFVAVPGCSNRDGEDSLAVSSPPRSAEAVRSAIASAQTAQRSNAGGALQDGTATTPNAPMAMAAPVAAAVSGTALDLGQLAMPNSASASAGLPPAIGAPRIYHLAGNTFFLDRSSAAALTREQHLQLMALKEHAATSYASAQHDIDQRERALWVLLDSETPDIAMIEATVGEISRLVGQQRVAFIRTVGGAVGLLSNEQRIAIASRGAPMKPATMGPPPPKGAMPAMGNDDSMGKMGGMPPPPPGSGGMGHM